MNMNKTLKIIIWVFVTVVVVSAIYMVIKKVYNYIPARKTEGFEEPPLKIYLFYAVWCPHCEKYLDSKVFMSTYDGLKQQSKFEKVTFVQVDFDKNKELGNKYGISGFPSIIAVSGDQVLGEFQGDRYSKVELQKFVEDNLKKL